MKVLFATYPMAFHTPGGGEIQLLAYEEQLRNRGVEVARFDPWNPEFLKYDLLHFFSVIGGSAHFCNFVRDLGLPLVVSSSLWMDENTQHLFPTDEIRQHLGLADKIITNSPTESTTLARVLGLAPDKFACVMNAVDDRFFEPADPALFRQKAGIEGDFVLCVGNVEPRKNQLGLMDATAQFPDLPIVLIGAIRDADYYREVAARGGTRLRYFGHVSHDAKILASAYRACSVFALPSLFETPGLAALEAAAQGAPIVITQHGSTRDYFGNAATYVDPFSTASISAAIAKSLPVRSERGVHDADLAYTPLGWTDVVGDLVGVYENAIAARNERTGNNL